MVSWFVSRSDDKVRNELFAANLGNFRRILPSLGKWAAPYNPGTQAYANCAKQLLQHREALGKNQTAGSIPTGVAS